MYFIRNVHEVVKKIKLIVLMNIVIYLKETIRAANNGNLLIS